MIDSASHPQKLLDPLALASLTTGVVLCDEGFAPVSEAAEWVLGHSVYTHEFILADIKNAMKTAILEQFPTMPTHKPHDWRAMAASLRAEFGDRVLVKRGERSRTSSPLATLSDAIEQAKERAAETSDPP